MMTKRVPGRGVSAAEKKRRSAPLREWCAKFGRGAITHLTDETGLTFAAASRIVHGSAAPRPETAAKIERATGGAVRAAALVGLEAA